MRRPLTALRCAACVLAAALAGHAAQLGADASPRRGAQLLRMFELPPLSLTAFGYTQSQLDAAAPRGLLAFDRPGIGSGLMNLGGNEYVAITDRGPNLDHFPVDASCAATSATSNGKTFPLPQFTPALVFFRSIADTLRPSSIVNLVDGNGDPVTGITNDVSDDTPFADPCSNNPLAYNPGGMDVEDLVVLGGGKFLGVEENKPSLFVGDLATGEVQKRYTPLGKTLPGAGYAVSDTLPALLVNRRSNRGFEAIALGGDGVTAYTATQSPLGSNAAGSPYRNSRVLRILKLDVTDPYDIQVTGQFIVLMSDRTVYPASINQRDLKLSAMAWIGPDKLLLLERSDESRRGGVRLLIADLSGATNLQGTAFDSVLTPEDAATNLAALGITPASTTVAFEEFETDATRIFWSYKLEGLSLLNANDVALINDNDFGVLDPSASTNLWVVRLADAVR